MSCSVLFSCCSSLLAFEETDNSVMNARMCVLTSGFLEVRENWEKSGNLSGQGKVRAKYFFV